MITRSLTSASNLHQRELCPGSAHAEQGRPNEENDDSKEGTMLHHLDAEGSKDHPDLTEDQRYTLISAARNDEAIFAAVSQKMDLGDAIYQEGREDERWLRRGLKKLFVGHPDRWRYYPERKILVVIDKKFGRIEVTRAEVNRQLLAYALMVAAEFDVEHVFTAINQPRLKAPDNISIGYYTAESLTASEEIVFDIYDSAHHPDGSPRDDAPRIAGLTQCRYCKAKLECDAYRERYAMLTANPGQEVFVGALPALTEEQLDSIFQAIKFAGVIEDAVKAEIISRRDAGGMANYDLQGTGSTTTITDKEAAAHLLINEGMDVADVYQLQSPATLAKGFAKAKGLSEKDGKAAMETALAGLIEKKPKAPALKRKGNLLKAPSK